jgi:phage FluMu protein Com
MLYDNMGTFLCWMWQPILQIIGDHFLSGNFNNSLPSSTLVYKPNTVASTCTWKWQVAVWHPYRVGKTINQFLWQKLKRMLASKCYAIMSFGCLPLWNWIKLSLRKTPSLWCKTCLLHEYEGLDHLSRKCPECQALWEWVGTDEESECVWWIRLVIHSTSSSSRFNSGQGWQKVKDISRRLSGAIQYGTIGLAGMGFDASPTCWNDIVMLKLTQVRQHFFIGWHEFKGKVLVGKLLKARVCFFLLRTMDKTTIFKN